MKTMKKKRTRQRVKLYEISALVSYHVVIAATSEKDAMEAVETWENAWHDTGDLVEVSNVDMFDIRPMKGKLEDWNDEAHDISAKAYQILSP